MNEPEKPEEKESFGLDKTARLAAERAEVEENGRPEPLDPPFPFRVIAFDPVTVTESRT
jgi:hypothetical protein